MIDEKGLSLEMPAHNQSSDLSQDRCHIDTTISGYQKSDTQRLAKK
ncbi:3480_t:CDS:2 [Dentiscutata heterogama]|uniref:3480_t:CDS:1 n=1 Tax=Dentiscutata heterogama TaxID=1316150 RepID=A0ACA9KFI2_9GLOM|nr:3480_t:CDS:2 [Dentiscutata heterogama]